MVRLAPRRWIRLAVLIVVGPAPEVRGACNTIPPAIQPFRSAAGAVDRPFAGPGDWVELSGDACRLPDGFPGNADQYDLAVAFIPSRPAPPSVVVLTPEACEDGAVQGRLASCRGELPRGARVVCRTLRLTPPVADLEKPRGRQSLRFRFPDTDELVGMLSDDLTLTGPAAIGVVQRGARLPCGALASGCTDTTGALACIATLYAEGTCAREPHTRFSGFTALPPANDYAALCTQPAFPDGPCTGAAGGSARLAVDASGNLLIPVDWSGVLVRQDEVPVPRLLRASTVLEAFSGVLGTLRVPGSEFLESFSPEGRSLPPLFQQQVDLAAGGDVFRLFGSADAPYTVLRVNRRAVRGRCSGGTRACGADFECPVGETCARYLACDAARTTGDRAPAPPIPSPSVTQVTEESMERARPPRARRATPGRERDCRATRGPIAQPSDRRPRRAFRGCGPARPTTTVREPSAVRGCST